MGTGLVPVPTPQQRTSLMPLVRVNRRRRPGWIRTTGSGILAPAGAALVEGVVGSAPPPPCLLQSLNGLVTAWRNFCNIALRVERGRLSLAPKCEHGIGSSN